MKKLIVLAAIIVSTLATTAGAATTSAPTPTQAAKAYMHYLLPMKPMPIHVQCAASSKEWALLADQYYGGDIDPQRLQGFALPNGQVWLAPWVCYTFHAGPLKPDLGSQYEFGAAAYVLTHEATHQLGYSDEAETSCQAIRWGPSFLLKKYWPRQYPRLLNKVQREAQRYYKMQPPEYKRLCKS